jgi:hypothetical protein
MSGRAGRGGRGGRDYSEQDSTGRGGGVRGKAYSQQGIGGSTEKGLCDIASTASVNKFKEDYKTGKKASIVNTKLAQLKKDDSDMSESDDDEESPHFQFDNTASARIGRLDAASPKSTPTYPPKAMSKLRCGGYKNYVSRIAKLFNQKKPSPNTGYKKSNIGKIHFKDKNIPYATRVKMLRSALQAHRSGLQQQDRRKSAESSTGTVPDNKASTASSINIKSEDADNGGHFNDNESQLDDAHVLSVDREGRVIIKKEDPDSDYEACLNPQEGSY